MMKSCGMIAALVAALLVLTAAGCGVCEGTTTSAASAASTSTSSATSTSTSSATSTSTSATTTPQTTVTADEYDVYNALIESVYIGANKPKQIIITTVHTDHPSFGRAAGVMESFWPDLGDDVVHDFKAKNKTSSDLERRFTLSVPYTLMSEQEVTSIFSTTVSGWKKFYAKYPDAKGFLALPHVGFNQAKDTAVLYTEYQSTSTAGEGDVVLMKKTDGRWTVEENSMFWQS